MAQSLIDRLAATAAVYKDRRILAIALMGFSSGLPFPLTTSTLGVWLAEEHVSLATIGFFALAGISYNVKFLWAPVMDRAPLGWFTRRFGRRRGWALATQLVLVVAIFLLGNSNPPISPWVTALFAVLVAFSSASQDIVIDALRVDLLSRNEQGAGASATQFGWRIGALVSGAGALYAASFIGWHAAYTLMAAFVLIGTVGVLLVDEPGREKDVVKDGGDILKWLRHAVIDPFVDFMSRHLWLLILAFIVLYKVGDALTGVMASPFYVAMGFTKIEIANITKIFGFVASIIGIFLGGTMAQRLGFLRALLVCGLLQMGANAVFAAQAVVGHSPGFLVLTIAIDNVSTAMGGAALVAYLSSLCSPAFTATQYALLSALATVPRTFLASTGGSLAEQLGWTHFFLANALAALPGLALLLWLMRKQAMARAR